MQNNDINGNSTTAFSLSSQVATQQMHTQSSSRTLLWSIVPRAVPYVLFLSIEKAASDHETFHEGMV